MKWISVKDKLPDVDIYVLGYNISWGETQVVCRKSHSLQGYCFLDSDDYNVNITHWMPLPKPPKEEV